MTCPVLDPRRIRPDKQDKHIPVLLLIDQLCELGGAERVLLRMANELPAYGFSPSIATFAIDESLGIRDIIRCPLYVFPLRRTYDRAALRVAGQIRHLVRSQNIQITHTFHETADLWGGIVAKLSGCPILISSRRDMGFQRQAKHRIAYRWLRSCFDEVQVVSDEVRRFCIDQDRLSPERVVTLYNGIRVPPTLPARADKTAMRDRFKLPAGAPLVVSVGHIRRIKGFDVYMRIAARVRAAVPGAVFAVAGMDHEPTHTRDLHALATDLGLGSNFVFLGDVADVTSLLRAADVFCLPSRSEGLSNALLEAMACELPCVASRVGGNSEVVIHGRTGYLFDNEDHESAADSIVRLLADPAAAHQMGVAGRSVVAEKFTTEAMMTRLVNSYERLLSTRRKNI